MLVRDILHLREWRDNVVEDRVYPLVRPKNKLTFPEGTHSPQWDWPASYQWLKSECATGCHPRKCFETCSFQLPLHCFWKGSAGGSSRASVPGWASPDRFFPSCLYSASFPSSFPFLHSKPSFFAIFLAPSRLVYIRFSERQKRLGSFWKVAQNHLKLAETTQVWLKHEGTSVCKAVKAFR